MWMRVGLVWFVLVGVAAADDGAGLGSKDPGLYNLKGQIYYLPNGTPRIPSALEKQKAEGVIYAEKLDVPPRDFTQGFPGVTARFEWFAIVYEGRFQVTAAGVYGFRVLSDDGAIVWIDGKKIVNNDGLHPPSSASGQTKLRAGNHAIKVAYYQGPAREIALQLFVTPPKGQETIFSIRDYASGLGKAVEELGGEATSEGIRVRLDASLLFDVDKAVLKPAAKKALAKLAIVLKSYPTAAAAIGGYTSSEGEPEHNQKLSERRAIAVKTALGRLAPKTVKLSATGYGAANPIADNASEETRAPNRRVEVLVTP